ncbi:MAG: NAD(P)-dependent oxidoreductase [Acidobacteriota bacterium]
MKILVTGANGFIGHNLVSRLSGQHEVLAVAREPRLAHHKTASFVVMDLSLPLDMRAMPSQMDVIVHLAQANVSWPEGANELFAVNTSATQQLLDYGRRAGARQFILASTGDVYGRRAGLAKETDAAQPASHYAATKYAAEFVVQSYCDYLASCILRLYQPYGPGQLNRLIPKLAERIRQQSAVRLHKNDGPRLTPIYIDDVTRAVERAIASSYSGTVNIAGDQIVSMRELAEAIGRALKSQPSFVETDETMADLMGDNSLMKEVLGNWDMIALADGLARTFGG